MKRWRNHFQEVLNCPEPLMSLNDEHLHDNLDISVRVELVEFNVPLDK